MIEAVLLFGFLSALFEAIVLWKVCPRWMLMNAAVVIHLMVIGLNLFIHYGTVTGTMSAIVAGLASFGVVPLMRGIK